MAGTELTLAAALRDVDAKRFEARNIAIRNLAVALLDELGMRPPTWWDLLEHPQRDAVERALEQACDDPSPHNAGLARVGLASLAAPTALARVREAIATDAGEDDDDHATFIRECGVIGLSLIGSAARSFLDEPERPGLPADARARAEATRAEVLELLTQLLHDSHDDVRFQAGPALVEVAGERAEPALLAAFEREQNDEVRTNLIAALSMLDPPSPAACDVLAAVLQTEQGKGELGWEAAMALTAARRPEGAPRLLEALRRQSTRDRALEAIAVLGRDGPPELADAVRRYTTGFLVPVFTRVRAAYALARIEPEQGLALLDKLGHHLRPAVREAVAEARANLARLAAEGDPPRGDAYRRE